VPGVETGVTSVAKGPATKIPVIAPVNTATSSSGPPVIVPKAEEPPAKAP
jgi:hypothetical protein